VAALGNVWKTVMSKHLFRNFVTHIAATTILLLFITSVLQTSDSIEKTIKSRSLEKTTENRISKLPSEFSGNMIEIEELKESEKKSINNTLFIFSKKHSYIYTYECNVEFFFIHSNLTHQSVLSFSSSHSPPETT